MQKSLRNTGRRSVWRAFLMLAMVALLAGNSARAALSDYQFSQGTGTATNMSSATYITSSHSGWQSYDDSYSNAIDIGFSFTMGGSSYTQFRVNSNGLMGLGSGGFTTAYSNSAWSAVSSYYPVISALWDDMELYGGLNASVRYLTTGTTGNRVLTVEWYIARLSSGVPITTQVRLYEGSNKIEFWYGSCSSPSVYNATIGAAISNTDYAVITPGSPATISYSTFNANTTPPSANTLYTLSPCQSNINIAGNVAQGGTAGMASGDTLVKSVLLQRGNTATYTPFSISMGNQPCSAVNYSYTISGASAADYSISPASGPIGANTTLTPTLTFRPSGNGGNGPRYATLTVSDDRGFSRTYVLAGSATTRIRYSGTPAQGGTTAMNNGDTIMQNIIVLRRNTQSFTPLTVTNFNANTSAPSAPVTFQIIDPTGQYVVSPTSASIGANQSISPVITFMPTGVGFQEAKLIVTADGEAPRTYILRAYAAAPGGEFFIGGEKLSSQSSLYVNQSSCVGEVANTQTVTVRNTGVGNFTIDAIDFYSIDTNYVQGASRFALKRDAMGRAISSSDYVVTTMPTGAPISRAQMPTFPVVIPQGQSLTLYLTYVGQRPGKRYARAFIRTNGQNLSGVDTITVASGAPQTLIDGVLNFDLFARGQGAILSDNNVGGLPKTVTFPVVAIGDSADATVTLTNPGLCDLRISQKFMQIAAGDASEFTLLGGLTGVQVDGNGDYVLAPGQSATTMVRFKPTMNGSRRASLWLKTNDSTVYIPGVAERGSYYLDLYGVGKPTLLATQLDLGMAAIGADQKMEAVTFHNPSRSAVTVNAVAITGTDMADFTQWNAAPWPTAPRVVAAGGNLKLGVMFAPLAGSDGPRTANLEVTLSTGEKFTAVLNGMAGSRTLTLNPASVTFAPIAAGKQARQIISITNTGSMPVMMTAAPSLSGPNKADFTLSSFPRTTLEPGQIEFLEVTYKPTAAGSATAQVDFASNAGTAVQSVAISATASKTQLDVDPSSLSGLVITGGISGQRLERAVVLHNEGSEAVRINSVSFAGTDAAQFRVTRGVERLEAGASAEMMIEVQSAGRDLTAELRVEASNEVTGEQVLRIAEVRAAEQRTSGVRNETAVAGVMELGSAVPNPTRGAVEVSYVLERGAEVTLGVYDVNGTLVRVVENGRRDAGRHVVRVDLGTLPSGQYQYRLTADGVSVARPVVVVK